MNRFSSPNINKSLKMLAIIAGFCLMAPTWADEAPSGTVSMESKSIAVGVGVSWGRGTLNYNGVHHFTVNGLTVLDLGVAKAHASGEVFHLNNVSDFSGNYVAAAVGIAVGGGANDVVMQNEKGVVLRLRGTEAGLRLQAGGKGVTITVQD
jgi:hypothetical protein